MRILWDSEKSKATKKKHGTSLSEASKFCFGSEIGGGLICDDPEQHLSILGTTSGKLISICYEIREDDKGYYIWLVTLWKTTKEEKRRYGLA